MKIQYCNAIIFHGNRMEKGSLWCSEGEIIPPQQIPDVVVDLKEQLIAPGYIDLQINGLHDLDFNSVPESVVQAAALLPRYGVTSFLPTVITSTPAHYQNILPKIPNSSSGAAILGIHLEGPFLNPVFCGAHPAACFRELEGQNPLLECYGSLDHVKLVTLAPELPNALRWIQYLTSKGIKVAAGHTNCTPMEFFKACEAGLCMATHLYNAMTPFHHRAPGIVGAVLSSQSHYYSIIADGIHVDPLAVKMAWSANPRGLVLVSDSVAATLGERRVVADNQGSVLEGTTTFAGSSLTLDKAVRLLLLMTGCSIAEAIEAATIKPATILGLENRKGLLKEGYDADFLILNDLLEVKATFIAGKQAWNTATSEIE
jgi:N-acetylglucosamine-6-phosphate deacetylase